MEKVCTSRILRPRRWLRRRGYGVHSPFVYQLARKVLLHGGKGDKGDGLTDVLRGAGVNHGSASRLHVLAGFLEPRSLEVVSWPDGERIYANEFAGEGRWRRMTIFCAGGKGRAPGYSPVITIPRSQGTVLVVAGSRRRRTLVCREIHSSGECLCIDTKGLTIYIYDHKLPARQFNL